MGNTKLIPVSTNNAYRVRLDSTFDSDKEDFDVYMFKISPCVHRRFAEKFIKECRNLFNSNATWLNLNSIYEGLDTQEWWNGQYEY